MDVIYDFFFFEFILPSLIITRHFRQLINLSQLYDSNEVIDFVFPIAIALCGDKVADVRSSASRLVSGILLIGLLYMRFKNLCCLLFSLFQ